MDRLSDVFIDHLNSDYVDFSDYFKNIQILTSVEMESFQANLSMSGRFNDLVSFKNFLIAQIDEELMSQCNEFLAPELI